MTKDKGKEKEQEEVQQELAKVPEKPLILSPEVDTATVKEMVELAEKQVDYIKRIKIVSIKVTNYRDWIDQDGNPYLEISGTMKMNQLWGVSIKDQKIETETITDEKGTYKVIIISGRGEWRGYEITEIGTCTTRDKLFSKAYGQDKKQEDVSLENVIKAATTNFHNRLLKKILGFKFTWEDLKSAGVDIEKVKERKVKHADKGQAITDEEKQLQIKIGKMLQEMNPEDAPGALCAISEYSFKNKDGKSQRVAGVHSCGDLRGRRLEVVYGKVKDIYAKWKETVK